uniref:Peptidase S72 domain-containing protein n=1 Tax=Caenorhabditis tropicalis TaxID=1561998 RepID=A0A1I7TLP0_9PELO
MKVFLLWVTLIPLGLWSSAVTANATNTSASTSVYATTVETSATKIVVEKRVKFYCASGVLCTMNFTDHSLDFTDAINASMSIAGLHNSDIWMIIKNKTLIGVPLVENHYQYILGYTVPGGQNYEVPFDVIVLRAPPPNHMFHVVMDQPSPVQLRKNPELCIQLVQHLGNALRSPVTDVSLGHIWLLENQTAFTFHNYSLRFVTCDMDGIKKMEGMMTHGSKLKDTFAQDMGDHYHLRSVSLLLLNTCRNYNSKASELENPLTKENPWNTVLKVLIAIFSISLTIVLIVFILCFCPMKKKPKNTDPEQVELRMDMARVVEWVQNNEKQERFWSHATIILNGVQSVTANQPVQESTSESANGAASDASSGY